MTGISSQLVDARSLEQAELRPRALVDLRSGAAQPLDRLGVDALHLAVDGEVRVVEPGGDAVLGQARAPRLGSSSRQPIASRSFATREHAERELEVLDRARDRTVHVQVGLGERAGGEGDVPALRDDPVARLVPEHAAPVRGHADRAADVGAELERGEAGRDRGGRTARGAAGRALGVPRIARGAEDLVVALPVAGHVRRVGLAEHDRAGSAQPRDRDGVARRHVLRRARVRRRWCGCPRSRSCP